GTGPVLDCIGRPARRAALLSRRLRPGRGTARGARRSLRQGAQRVPRAPCPKAGRKRIYTPYPASPRGHLSTGQPDENTVSMKSLFTLIAPGALVISAAGMLLLFYPQSPVLAQAARGYPLVALAVAMLVAWRMHR